MTSTTVSLSPGLSTFLRNLKINSIESSIETLISLLKRRQIRQSHSCAVATVYLLMRVVSTHRVSSPEQLIERVQQVGRLIVAAQPREMVVGNIVRRVLGLIRDESEDTRFKELTSQKGPHQQQQQKSLAQSSRGHAGTRSRHTPHPRRRGGNNQEIKGLSPFDANGRYLSRPALMTHPSFSGVMSTPVISMFNLLSEPEPEETAQLESSPVVSEPEPEQPSEEDDAEASDIKDFKAEVLDGITEIVDELHQVDDQIAAYALEHIHSNEIILTYESSVSVQKFLLKAAARRKFTVIHVESYPNSHKDSHAAVTGTLTGDEEGLATDSFQKPLIALGITVILIPDSAVFALMSRVNKVILGTHSVLANGGLVAAAGSRVVASAAKVHKTPVVVVSGIYKLSPVYPFDYEALIEYGDASAVADYMHSDVAEKVDVMNPLYDYVPPELVDLYITNVGAHAPSYLYRIVSDHYRTEDITF
ncbi:translation initiation factor eIF-2B subunit beta [Trichophyton mentagrophytes]|uniref:Translation initiation factor eIF2B subunit beta n=1 Tax=Trichophyton interdigitale TaxID=101480 RepID=A0A9P5CUA2_9EURO|nr:Translation regulator GCD7 [Trichophyton interdigitale]KAF3892014.1 Translation regulator GCD7 [Trichophyton interdigitale]KAG8207409.1 Translation regulator GCD7 [Trichophyton interdigitale]GBF63999.1 translation initiation factor eIF-2B subunit beta [Trichophyton mentagrophytes]